MTTLAELREHMERRYWCDLLTRLPSLEAASRVAGCSRMLARRHLERLGIDYRAPGACIPPLEPHEIGLTLETFLDRHERWYWWRLLGCRNDRAGRSRRPVSEAAKVAGLCRDAIYYRLKRLGIKTWRQNAGSASWQALGA